jgi:hypothetical protein
VAVDISVGAKARGRTVTSSPTHRTDSPLRHSDEARLLRTGLDLAASIPTCMSTLRSNGSKRRVPSAFKSAQGVQERVAAQDPARPDNEHAQERELAARQPLEA